MANDVQLTAAMRANLVTLQGTSDLLSKTQNRLSTGKSVNSALDNPSAFFAASAHSTRANLLDGRKEAIGEAIQTIKAADAGVKSVSTLLETARGIISQARSAETANRATLASQFKSVMSQITNTIADSGYKGINLLDSGSLAVAFNEDNTTNLDVVGFDSAIGGTVILNDSNDLATFSSSTTTAANLSDDLDLIETDINDSLTNLRTESAGLAANLAILQARDSFLTDTVNNEIEGADLLTAADTNEEGANMLMLQTRQQLGITALSLASQAAQGVLRLF